MFTLCADRAAPGQTLAALKMISTGESRAQKQHRCEAASLGMHMVKCRAQIAKANLPLSPTLMNYLTG
jgi:hypothetical protein